VGPGLGQLAAAIGQLAQLFQWKAVKAEGFGLIDAVAGPDFFKQWLDVCHGRLVYQRVGGFQCWRRRIESRLD
jgi:hypothetical protein